MAETLSAYLPEDRLYALAHGQSLPDRARGSALLADISGFTPLTEQLTRELGPRRGIEGLTQRINAVYDALIRVVEQHGGSVVSFAGDAITGWFDQARLTEQACALQAAQCALALQAAMHAFPDLSLKVAVASGPARRFAVGDPQIQRLDTLAGTTIGRLSRAEQLARPGEVLADGASVEAGAEALVIAGWRVEAETQQRFVVVASSTATGDAPAGPAAPGDVPLETLRAWVLPTVYAREQGGRGEFLTELRPAVALFLRFDGIDYEADDAQNQLDAVVRRVQQVVAGQGGALLQLTLGDKGSYAYACFGAPTAHEDDPRRAVRAALALRDLPRELTFLGLVQIGLSRGTLRAGAYGGTTRRTYGALGDDVNLAARLMQAAGPGDIWVSGSLAGVLGETCTLEPLPPLSVRGKAGALTAFAVAGAGRRRATRLLEPAYRLPMVGRQAELGLIADKLALARQGQGQIIGINAEAGLGKSRLVAEAIRLARRQGFAAYGGACESSGTNTAYLAWKPIWQAFFDLDPAAPVRRQVRHLEGEIQDRAPDRLPALPLLGPILDLPLDDNDFTRTLEPKDRRNALEALLEDCVKAAAKEEPLLFVLEDVHWIDPLSHDLLESLARATASQPVCFLLAYRPFELARLESPRVEALPQYTRIALAALTSADAEQLIRAKLAQLYPERGGDLPKALVKPLTTKAQGNPFYIEELLNYLRDRDINPYDARALSALELPSSLHTLILSRIDQLTEAQKVTLKVASIIGRLFPFAWLHGYYPALGPAEGVKADLDELARLDLTPLDTPEPELAYLFKHVVTQEVAYESLAHATRAQLHEQLARYLEAQGGDRYLDTLAFHYGRSENTAKQREYYRMAGEAAQAAFANAAALDYYERLLPLLSEPAEQIDLHLKRGAVLELVGEWDGAEAAYRAALGVAEGSAAAPAVARAHFALGGLEGQRGEFDRALAWLEQASAGWQALGDLAGWGRARAAIGWLHVGTGDFARARQAAEEGLALGRAAQDRAVVARALNALGLVANARGDYAAARGRLEESLALRRELGDKRGMSASLSNLGLVANAQGDYAAARGQHEESLALDREMGDKWGIAIGLGNLGLAAYAQGDYAAARGLHEESLALSREMGDKGGIARSLNNLGMVAQGQGDYAAARPLHAESLRLGREIDLKTEIVYAMIELAAVAVAHDRDAARAARLAGAAEALRGSSGYALEPDERGLYERTVAQARAALGDEAFNTAFAAGQALTMDDAVALALAQVQES